MLTTSFPSLNHETLIQTNHCHKALEGVLAPVRLAGRGAWRKQPPLPPDRACPGRLQGWRQIPTVRQVWVRAHGGCGKCHSSRTGAREPASYTEQACRELWGSGDTDRQGFWSPSPRPVLHTQNHLQCVLLPLPYLHLLPLSPQQEGQIRPHLQSLVSAPSSPPYGAWGPVTAPFTRPRIWASWSLVCEHLWSQSLGAQSLQGPTHGISCRL